MKYLILAILLIPCASSAEVWVSLGAGKNQSLFTTDLLWDDRGGTGSYLSVLYRHKISEKMNFTAGWSHYSQIDVGRPMFGEVESTLDHIGVAVEVRVY